MTKTMLKIPKIRKKWDLFTPLLILGIIVFIGALLMLTSPLPQIGRAIVLNGVWLGTVIIFGIGSHLQNIGIRLHQIKDTESVKDIEVVKLEYKNLLKSTFFKQNIYRDIFIFFYEIGNFETAKLYFSKIRIKRKDHYLLYLKGCILQKEENYVDAINTYEGILLQKKYTDVLSSCAYCYFITMNYEKSESYYISVLQFIPNDFWALRNLALLYYYTNRPQESLSIINNIFLNIDQYSEIEINFINDLEFRLTELNEYLKENNSIEMQ